MSIFLPKIHGIEGIDNDYNRFYSALQKNANAALHSMYNDIAYRLQEEIMTAYNMYVPVEYERRLYNPYRGIPIVSTDYMTPIEDEGKGGIIYEPETYYVDEDGVVESGRDSEELIYWFGRKHNYKTTKIPERPFWAWFSERLIEGGEADLLFSYWLNEFGEQTTPTKNVVRENEDILYTE